MGDAAREATEDPATRYGFLAPMGSLRCWVLLMLAAGSSARSPQTPGRPAAADRFELGQPRINFTCHQNSPATSALPGGKRHQQPLQQTHRIGHQSHIADGTPAGFAVRSAPKTKAEHPGDQEMELWVPPARPGMGDDPVCPPQELRAEALRGRPQQAEAR